MREERWRNTEVYGYQVSDLGRIKSFRRYTDGRILSVNRRRYCQVELAGVTHLVHRLVAKAFIDNSDDLSDVDHLDFNKHNNNMANLCWSTHQDNSIRSIPNMITAMEKRRETAISGSLRNG